MRPTRLRAAALLAPLVLLPALSVLSACGSDRAAPEVASLPTPDAPAASTSSDATTGTDPGTNPGADDADDERPVFRVDDTEERRRTIWNAYLTCLLDHGASPPPDGMYLALGDVAVDLPGPPAARRACQHLEPLQPPALEAATNPDFHDQSVAYVACLQERGLWVTLLNSRNLDWTYAEDHPVPDDSAEIEQECLVETFGGA